MNLIHFLLKWEMLLLLDMNDEIVVMYILKMHCFHNPNLNVTLTQKSNFLNAWPITSSPWISCSKS